MNICTTLTLPCATEAQAETVLRAARSNGFHAGRDGLLVGMVFPGTAAQLETWAREAGLTITMESDLPRA